MGRPKKENKLILKSILMDGSEVEKFVRNIEKINLEMGKKKLDFSKALRSLMINFNKNCDKKFKKKEINI